MRTLGAPLEDILAAVCDSASVALLVLNAEQRLLYMNPAAEALSGTTLSQRYGQPASEVLQFRLKGVSSQDAAALDPFAMPPLAKIEAWLVDRDGPLRPVSFTVSPLRKGEVQIGTILELQDMSDAQEVAEERELLRDIGMLILAEDEVQPIIDAVTEAARKLVGAEVGAFFHNDSGPGGPSYQLYALTGMPRQPFDSFPHPRATELFGPTFRGEATVRIADVTADPRYGKLAPYHGMPPGHPPVRSYMAVPVKRHDGTVVGALFFGHRKPDRFRSRHEGMVEALAAQAALGMTKAALLQATRQERSQAQAAAAENERLYKAAADANRLKDEFLATVSHELRTPLSAILGWARILATGQAPAGSLDRAIQAIDRNARAQAQIIDDLLDISRIISGKMRLDVQMIMPHLAVEAAIEAVRLAAEAKSIELVLSLDTQAGPIPADSQRLQQVVWNLLSNAVKFSPKDEQIFITLRLVESHIEISVTDRGRGMDGAFLPRAFDRFSQSDATAKREHGGLGLGLAIVKQLVELHGGTVGASSPGLGQGSTFTVQLPMGAAARPGVAPRRQAEVLRQPTGQVSNVTLAGSRVVLVEDDNDTREMLGSILTMHGAEVAAFPSALDALEAWRSLNPTVIISDIAMPEMTGHEFIREVRRLEAASAAPMVPSIALTAFARVEDRVKAMAEGFQMHVAKPVEPAELVAIVSTLRDWSCAR